MENVIDIGIINFNGGEYLQHCIGSIKNLKNVSCNLFILDNASSDNSARDAQNVYPDCNYLFSDKNLGYAGGCNLLLENMRSDIVVLCNMDLEFADDWGEKILECFKQNPDVSSIGSLVIDKETQIVYSSGVFIYKDLYPLCSNDKPAREKCYEVFGAYGAVMAFRRDVFDKIGTFDDDYFLFFEETEFYWRLNVNKLKTVLYPQAKVYHHRSVSTVKYSPLKLYYSERNRIWTAFKYLPLWYFPLTFPLSVYRFYVMSKKGLPGKDGRGNKVNPLKIVMVLLKAWGISLIHLYREWKKRKGIWSRTDLKPADTLRIISKYKMPRTELKVK
ncbi:MAG: glycosyltransferase family 2 protein [Fibrobacter sp.]|nr:glycosyltransferase family 2 protein [Fibrobacter sp.]